MGIDRIKKKKRKIIGFTIVELLIVIVVIGVLSALVIVSYNGVSKRAIEGSIQTDLNNASNKLRMYNTDNGQYPESVDPNTNCPSPTDDRYCLKPSSGTKFFYTGSSDNKSFTLYATNNGITYSITQDSSPMAVAAFSATGGSVTYVDSNGQNPRSSGPYTNGYTIHTFTSSGTLSTTGITTADIFIIGGGGGGGAWNGYAGGGGGAGQYLYLSNQTISGNISVSIGNGGSGGVSSQGGNGGNSSFGSTHIALGGGGGGGGTTMSNGRDGASGGGAAGWVNIGGTGTAGYNGGNNIELNSWAAGGGGCGAVGSNASSYPYSIGNGGAGRSSTISGNTVWYCGGGGGGSGPYSGTGGSGGGGNGGTTGSAGSANTGSGGGGGSTSGGSGGSGLVIVKYPS